MERRDDIGIKIMGGITMTLITLFVAISWSTANEGKNKAWEISSRMDKMESRFDSFASDLVEIKELLRRKIPG